MADLLDALRLVTSRLDAADVPYMVSGSLALGYYAQPRMTRDIDIVVELERANVPRLVAVFADDFYCDEDAIVRAVESRRLVNLIHLDSAYKIDLIVRKDSEYRRVEFLRRRRVVIDGFEIWIVTPEDLLLSKLVWSLQGNSELQLRDAAALAASVPTLDWTYIDQWAQELGVAKSLGELHR
ncbi:MAG: hypothetical protein NTV05_18700 [Acidobacteria bacterium]|nr:hypothetical protein [Acidobacteriota bacterium]